MRIIIRDIIRIRINIIILTETFIFYLELRYL